MEHWIRKHMGDIAWVAKRCATQSGLPPEQANLFVAAKAMAHELAIGSRELSLQNIEKAVALLCAPCRAGFPSNPAQACAGRISWHMPCRLIKQVHDDA